MSVSKVEVRVRKQTHFEGRALRPDDTITVSETVAKRWQDYGIAEVIEGISQTAKASQDTVPAKAAPSVAFEDVPHAQLLAQNDIHTVDEIPRTLAELVDLEGIGTAKARDILEVLDNGTKHN